MNSNTVAHRVMAFAAKEEEQFDALLEPNCADRFIAACYQRIRSFDKTRGSERKRESISDEVQVGALTDLADRAFTLGWNSKNLTHLQRAQLLDILLSIADLMVRHELPCGDYGVRETKPENEASDLS